MAGPKTLPKAMPKTPPKAATRVAPGKPQVKAMPKNVGSKPEIDLTYTWSAWVLDLALLKPPLASGRQGKGASFSWQGFRCGRQWTSSRRQRCRSAAFHMVPRAGGVTLPGAQLMTFAAAYSQERSEQWTDVWPAVKHTVWNGDNVLIHCIKGRHRGAYLGVLCRALLAGETIEAANSYVEGGRETELNKVIKDQHEEVAEQSLPGQSCGGPASGAARLCSHGTIQHTCAGRRWHHFVPA